MTTIVLHGPQGCGKTAIAHELAAQHRTTRIVDEWLPGMPLERGAIHVTHVAPGELPADVQVVSALDWSEEAASH